MLRAKTKIFRVLVILFLVSALILGLFSSTGCFSECEPGCCPNNPLIIKSVKDLETFASDLEDGNSYSDKFITLKSDISINKHNKILWKNLKKNGTLLTGTFNGSFNGNGHTITIVNKDDSKKSEKILFESLGNNAKVKNLKVKSDIIL